MIALAKKILLLGLVFSVFISEQTLAAEMDSNYFTYDIGASTGSSGGRTYSELNLGLNYWFTPALAWRNSIFGRQVEDNDATPDIDEKDTIYGLDTSIRGRHYFEFSESTGMTIFVGPGYRFQNKGENVPIGEGGLLFRLGSLSVGGSVKALLYELVDPNRKTEVQYSIILSGGGRL